MNDEQWTQWKADRGMLPPKETPTIKAVTRLLIERINELGGENPVMFAVPAGVHADLVREISEARERLGLPVLSERLDCSNILLMGIPVVVEHR